MMTPDELAECLPKDLEPIDARLLFSLIGVAEGVLWWVIDPFSFQSASNARLGIPTLFFASSGALTARLTWGGRAVRRWMVVATVLAIMIAAISLQVCGQLPDSDVPYAGDGQRLFAWTLGAFVLLYVVVPFAQIYQRSGALVFPYVDLFEHSWNNFIVGAVALVFLAVSWLFLFVWGALFEVVGVPLFSDLFESSLFVYISTFTMFGYGLGVGRANENVIGTLRRITLMIAHALLPFVALAALLFVLILLWTGMEPLWETGRATPLVLALLGLLTICLNGVIEDGEREPSYPKVVILGIKAGILSMPVLAAIALCSTSLRIQQYGFTPSRVYALLFVCIASLYAVGYAISVVWRSVDWIYLVTRVNIATAIVLAGVAILVQLPLLDPLRLSAENQIARLREGQVSAKDFDFATMRFRLGRYGWAGLHELDGMHGHPEYAEIRTKVEIIRAVESFWLARQALQPSLQDMKFVVVPQDLELPPGLREAFAQHRTDPGTGTCARSGECLVLGVDLDGDRVNEFCLLGGESWWYSRCYAMNGGAFESIGSLHFRGEGARPSVSRLEQVLRDEPVPTMPPAFREIDLGDGALILVPSQFSPRITSLIDEAK